MNLLEAMRYLAALDQHRHFGRAAQACHITQPALSNALRALEGELGAVLVKRGRQYEGLTAEGEVTLAHAHRLLQGTEVLRQEIACLAGAPRGVLRIGAIPTAVPIAARFAARLRGQHPGIRPVLTNLSSQAIESGLESLAIDLALGYVERGGAVAGRLDLLPQYSERYFLVRRAAAGEGGAALVFGAPLRWADAAAYPLALLTAEMHNRVIVDGAFVAAGAQAQAAFETDSVIALTQAVLDAAAGGLAAVLPGTLVGSIRNEPGLIAHGLIDPLIATSIGWITARATSPTRVAAAALALARDGAWLAHLRTHTGDLARVG